LFACFDILGVLLRATVSHMPENKCGDSTEILECSYHWNSARI